MNEAFIIDGIRTPIGSFRGSLSPVRTDDLAAHVIRELMKRNPGLPPERIDDVLLGCVNQAGEDNRNVSRMALLLAGLPVTVPGETINRLCASGMSAVAHATRLIRNGEADLVIAGGVEHMTRGPWVISKTSQGFGNDAQMYDSSFGWRFINPEMHRLYGTDAMGVTAEHLAEKYKISREDQDHFAWRSQVKAAMATSNGRLKKEIVPVSIPVPKQDTRIFETDEFIKPSTTPEVLAKLKPAFKKDVGTVTAGNSSGLNDGAAALLIASEKAIQELNLKPIVRILGTGVAGVEPRIMGIGPVPATAKAMAFTGKSLSDMDIIELNEAFAAQSLACIREWGLPDDDPRLNPNGGAIALGHPLGMSGARIVLTAALELAEKEKKLALATMCIGVGQGYATILERV